MDELSNLTSTKNSDGVSFQNTVPELYSTVQPGSNPSSGNLHPAAYTSQAEDREQTQLINQNILQTFNDLTETPDLVCFSHLRWDFVFQRPQHLLTRFASHLRVYFFEEPIFDADPSASYLEVRSRGEQLWILTPHFPGGRSAEEDEAAHKQMVKQFMQEQKIENFIAWYYTAMAIGYSRELTPLLTVYDCMDELAAFAGAPPALLEREKELFGRADLVFTGGQSLYEAKRDRHARVYAFPSSIDRKHFGQARTAMAEPADQVSIPYPRLGFFGVIDERMDIALVGEVARQRPEWQIVLLGPVVKIDPNTLPKHANIHYLGMKSYDELPAYISQWDVALLPFALNESTKFISPTKTPEYLAAGKPVVSTPITDVIRPYGDLGLVHIAHVPQDFILAVEKALLQNNNAEWLAEVDDFLSNISWDHTWAKMADLMCRQLLQQESQ